MGRNDDSDVKIFEPQSSQSEKDDIITIVEETCRQRQNGNSAKAKLLGKELALFATDEKRLHLSLEKFGLEQKDVEQFFALVQFSVEAALNFYLPSNLLSTIAVNTLQEALIKKQNLLYESALNGSSFSFYYLSVRKGGKDLPLNIGRAFAMLCGMENNDDYINSGKEIYLHTLSLVEEKIRRLEFVNS